jgi:ABC-type phosphate transport system permease subunit
MGFIERIFHLSPDNGSGMLEAAIVIVVFIVPVALALSWQRRSARRH